MSKGTQDSFLELVVNIDAAISRTETLEDREHFVVPVVMMVEGVHNGSGGPLYYSEEVLANAPQAWDHKPIVVYHPELSGRPVTASNPTILNKRKIGVLLNTRFEDGKLKAEAWIDVEKAKKVDSRVVEAIENNEPMEVSTGLTGKINMTEGIFNGESYSGSVEGLVPDHLAVLPDEVGACSRDKGAGLLVNSNESREIVFLDLEYVRNVTHGDIVRELGEQLRSRFRDASSDAYIYIEDVEGSDVIYGTYNNPSKSDRYFRIGFSVNGDEVTLSDETPVEVLRRTRFVPAEPNGDAITQNQKSAMDKKATIEAILQLENTGLAEKDAETLESLPEDVLTNMHDSYVKTAKAISDAEENARVAGEKAVTNSQTTPNNPSFDEILNSAPPEIRESIQHGTALLNAARNQHVQQVLANKENTFSEDDLKKMPFGMLAQIANLAKAAEPQTPGIDGMFGAPRFTGMAPLANATVTEEPMVAPDVLAANNE